MQANSTLARSAVALIALLVSIGVGQTGNAIEVAYRFDGHVTAPLFPLWNRWIPFDESVTGVFSYDTDSPGTAPNAMCNCMRYRQQRPNGFFAQIGTTYVRADDYVVEVLNRVSLDEEDEDSELVDILAINWANQFSPPIEGPLYDGPTPHTTGWFSVNFVTEENLFDDLTLPEQVELSSFKTRAGLLSDNFYLTVNVFFVVESLTKLDLLDGDYDFDNDVDAADFTKWRDTFGSVGNLMADGDHDGIVNAADYTLWRDNFQAGMSSSAELVSAVPEPGVVPAIAMLGIAGCLLRRRHE